MTEVKGFELKRRGELKKDREVLQGGSLQQVPEDETLQQCYDACGEVSDRFFGILDSKAEYIVDVDVQDYIFEE